MTFNCLFCMRHEIGTLIDYKKAAAEKMTKQ